MNIVKHCLHLHVWFRLIHSTANSVWAAQGWWPGPDRAGWLQDAGCWMHHSSPEFITPELEQPWLVLQTGHLHKVIYCPFTHPSYCKSHGGGLMLQWAVITSGPSPVSVLVYYPWHRSDCNIREEHSNCCNKTCNLHIEQQTGTWTSRWAKWAIHCWCWWPGEGWVIISSNWGPRDSWRQQPAPHSH